MIGQKLELELGYVPSLLEENLHQIHPLLSFFMFCVGEFPTYPDMLIGDVLSGGIFLQRILPVVSCPSLQGLTCATTGVEIVRVYLGMGRL